MIYTSNYFLENKYLQLLKIVSFYEKQIDVLDSMLYEVTGRFLKNTSESERAHFHRAFNEKQIEIGYLKRNIDRNNKALNSDLQENFGRNAEILVDENKKIEKEVMMMEKDINELNKEFRYFLISKM